MQAHDEQLAGTRIISNNPHFVAFVPYAAICPFETWIIPLRQQGQMHLMMPEEEAAFAEVLHQSLQRLHGIRLSVGSARAFLCAISAPRGDDVPGVRPLVGLL